MPVDPVTSTHLTPAAVSVPINLEPERGVQSVTSDLLDTLLFPFVLTWIGAKVVPLLFSFNKKAGALIHTLGTEINVPDLNVKFTEKVIKPAYQAWLDETHETHLHQIVLALKPAFLPGS